MNTLWLIETARALKMTQPDLFARIVKRDAPFRITYVRVIRGFHVGREGWIFGDLMERQERWRTGISRALVYWQREKMDRFSVIDVMDLETIGGELR